MNIFTYNTINYTICTLDLGEPDDEELEASSMNYIHQNMSLLL